MHKVKQSPILKSKLLVIRVAFLFIMLLVVLFAVETAQATTASNVGSNPAFVAELTGQ